MSDRRTNEIPDGEFGDENRVPVALILGGVIGVLALIFVIQNGGSTTTQFLWIDVEMKLWLTIVISIAVGVALDRLFSIWWRRNRRDDQ